MKSKLKNRRNKVKKLAEAANVMNSEPKDHRKDKIFSDIEASLAVFDKLPEWINKYEPSLPEYFSITVLDGNGEIVEEWKNLPLPKPTNAESVEVKNASLYDSEDNPIVHIKKLSGGWTSVEVNVINRHYFEICTGNFYIITLDEVIRLARKVAKMDLDLSEFWDSAGRIPIDQYTVIALEKFVGDLYKKGHIRNIDSPVPGFRRFSV